MTNPQRELRSRFRRLDGERGRLLVGESCRLGDLHLAGAPVECGRGEQIHLQLAVVGRVCVDHPSVFARHLQPRPGAAPHRVEFIAVDAVSARKHRRVIGRHRTLVVVGGEDVVEQDAFVEIHHPCGRRGHEQGLRQPQHVHRVAGFRARRIAQRLVERVGIEEVLPGAVAPNDPGTVPDDFMPRVQRRAMQPFFARDLVDVCETGVFRDVGVGVEVRQEPAIPAREGREHAFMAQAPGPSEILRIPGDPIRIHVGLMQRPVFALQQGLKLPLVQFVHDPLAEPIRQSQKHAFRLVAFRGEYDLVQAEQDLVERVGRLEVAVDLVPVPRQARDLDAPGRDFLEDIPAIPHRQRVARAVRPLDLFQLVDDREQTLAQRIVAGGLHGHGRPRHVEAEDVSRKERVLRFPAAIGRRFRLQSRFLAEPTQQTVRIKFPQVGAVQFLLCMQRSIQQTDVAQGEQIRLFPVGIDRPGGGDGPSGEGREGQGGRGGAGLG